MKKIFPAKLNRYRIRHGVLRSDDSFEFNGAFAIAFKRTTLRLISSDEMGWDHVQVSTALRTPTWYEMCFVKDLFFDSDEIAVQYHPGKNSYAGDQNFVLHLWKPENGDIPLPPFYKV